MGGPVASPGVWRPARSSLRRLLILVSVSSRRAVRLIFAGWLPQDGLFGWDAPAGLEADVAVPGGGSVVHRRIAGRPSRCDQIGDGQRGFKVGYSRTASDQIQPASSRAMATLATTGRFRRTVKDCHR